MKEKKRLTLKEFNQTVKFMEENRTRGRSPSAKTLKIAHDAIVEGLPLTEVAGRYQVTKQWVNELVDKYFGAYFQMSGYPPNWEFRRVRAPANMLAKFKAEVEKERQAQIAQLEALK